MAMFRCTNFSKRIALIGAIAGCCLLMGCAASQSTPPQPATAQSLEAAGRPAEMPFNWGIFRSLDTLKESVLEAEGPCKEIQPLKERSLSRLRNGSPQDDASDYASRDGQRPYGQWSTLTMQYIGALYAYELIGNHCPKIKHLLENDIARLRRLISPLTKEGVESMPTAHVSGRLLNKERDVDLDGIPNERDACPSDAEDSDGFEDQDGCPEPDNDQDGIADMHDVCPMEAGAPEDFGCPNT